MTRKKVLPWNLENLENICYRAVTENGEVMRTTTKVKLLLRRQVNVWYKILIRRQAGRQGS